MAVAVLSALAVRLVAVSTALVRVPDDRPAAVRVVADTQPPVLMLLTAVMLPALTALVTETVLAVRAPVVLKPPA